MKEREKEKRSDNRRPTKQKQKNWFREKKKWGMKYDDDRKIKFEIYGFLFFFC